MTTLNESLLIGKGSNRKLYLSPNDPKKGIKITYNGNFEESKKELAYYKQLEDRGTSLEMIAKIYGFEDTNLGPGLVVAIPRDMNGEISKTLAYYLESEERTLKIINPIELLKHLKRYLHEERIIVKNIDSTNLLYHKINADEAKLIVIDGMTNNEWIPVSTYINFFTQNKIQRRWDKMINRFKTRTHRDNKVFQTMLADEQWK